MTIGIVGIDNLYPEPDRNETVMTARKTNYDDTDVETALARVTADGYGVDDPEFKDGEELPPSDFDGHPEGVENDHDGDNVGSEEESSK